MLLLVRLSPWDLLCLLQISDCWRGDPVPLCVPNISRIYPHQPLSPCCLCWLLNEVWDPCIFFVCSFCKEKRWACLAGHELTPAALLRAAPCRRPPARGHSAGWTPVFSQQDSSVKTRLWLLSWLEGLLDEIGGTRSTNEPGGWECGGGHRVATARSPPLAVLQNPVLGRVKPQETWEVGANTFFQSHVSWEQKEVKRVRPCGASWGFLGRWGHVFAWRDSDCTWDPSHTAPVN